MLSEEISEKMLKKYEARENLMRDLERVTSKANNLYIQGPQNYSEVVKLLRQAIALQPTPGSFNLLASIYMSKSDPKLQRKATEMLMLAAHLGKSDEELWRRVYARYLEQGHIDEACYCLKRAAAALKRTDATSSAGLLKTKADLHLEHGHNKSKVISTLKMLLGLDITDTTLKEESLLLLAEVYHKGEKSDKALAILVEYLDKCEPEKRGYPTRIALMICEIHMEKGFFNEALDMITTTITRVFRCSFADLPPDFSSKFVICHLYLDDREQADKHAKYFMRKWPIGPDVPYAEAYYDMAKAYSDLGEHDMAMKMFMRLSNHKTFAQPNIRYQVPLLPVVPPAVPASPVTC